MQEYHPPFCLKVAALAAALCALFIASKKRSRYEDKADVEPRKRNNVERGVAREGVARRILGLDNATFRKMFRMSKEAFLLLLNKVEPALTSPHADMAKRSSQSSVTPLLLLAMTIRWLAGGSPWDICFGFHVSYATLHAKKYDVIAAINDVLAGAVLINCNLVYSYNIS